MNITPTLLIPPAWESDTDEWHDGLTGETIERIDPAERPLVPMPDPQWDEWTLRDYSCHICGLPGGH